MSLATEPVSPKATPLPPLPQDDPLTPAQWKTLLAIVDAVVPAIKPKSTGDAHVDIVVEDNEYSAAISALEALTPEDEPDTNAVVKEYLAESASSNPRFKSELQRLFGMYMPHSVKSQLLMVLNVLEYVPPFSSLLAFEAYFSNMLLC